jgi:hypothetical protein
MKKTFLLLIAFSALAAGLVQPGFGQSQQPEDEGSAARIARIENGLLSAVVIKGQAVRAMKISERMQFYKVTGRKRRVLRPRKDYLDARIRTG